MRNARVFLPQSSVLSAETTFALAPTFSSGETESSRSRNTRSALLAAAFSIMRSLLAGVDNSDRLKRMVCSFHRRVRASLQGIPVPRQDAARVAPTRYACHNSLGVRDLDIFSFQRRCWASS